MDVNYSAEHRPRFPAAVQFAFLCLFVPAFFYGIYFIHSRYSFGIPLWFVFGCVALPVSIALAAAFRIAGTKGAQRWSIQDGIVQYVSPSPLLGSSFQARLEDIDAVWQDGDSDFATCRLKSTGQDHQFDIRTLEGIQFFRLLCEYTNKPDKNSSDPML